MKNTIFNLMYEGVIYMTNAMEKLLKDFEKKVYEINYLLSLGVINMDVFIDNVIDTKDYDLIYDVTQKVKNVPLEKLVDALITLYFSTNKSVICDYLVEIAKTNSHAPFNKIVDILIEKSSIDENAAMNLSKLLYSKYNQEKLINAIVASKNFYAIESAQKILDYKNETIICGLLKFNEQDNMLFWNLFNIIVNGDSKYIPKLVIHIGEVFPEEYLFILLYPKAIHKIEESLEEVSKNNPQYLNILYNTLQKAIDQLEHNSSLYDYLKSISEHHRYLFACYYDSSSDWEKIFSSCKKIINKIEVNSEFIKSLDENKKFEHLMNLCKRGIQEPIIDNLEEFRNLFQMPSNDDLSKQGSPKIRKHIKDV